MAPGTHAGAAHPVRGDGVAMDPVMKEKMENYAASLLRSYVGRRGRNIAAAESAMKESKAFTAEEALEKNLINYIAKNETDLFAQLEGKTVTHFDGSKSVLHVAGKPIRVYEMTMKQHILGFLMDPNVLFLLFTVGMLCVYFEFNHPGAVAPGVLGFIAILLFFYAVNLLPFRSISLVLILLSPLLLAIALAVKITSRGPLLYRSRRPGIGAVPFECLKFRTMRSDADQMQEELEDLNEATGPLFKIRRDPRLTPLGRLLRRFSLDELPQLVNVLRGDMSLVGPRPLPQRDFDHLEDWHKKRYLVLPGVTGLWQVSGRSELDFDDLVRLDFLYLERWSVFLDVNILLKTIPAVLRGKGAF